MKINSVKDYLQYMTQNPECSACPIRFTLDAIGGKWKMFIILNLIANKTLRFGQIRRRIPDITNSMLSSSLREMEADGLITRTQYNELPVRVEYKITERGASLEPILVSIANWGLEQIL